MTATDAPRTCYAAPLGGCSAKLTREHYMSECILEQLDRNGKLMARGHPFLAGEEKHLAPNAFAARILCGEHNSALSPLDAEACAFFAAIDQLSELSTKRGRQPARSFNGNLIERWLLKLLLGLVASGQAHAKDGTSIPRDRVPAASLPVLFGTQSHVVGAGLYFAITSGEATERRGTGLGFVPYFRDDDLSPTAIRVDLNKLHLMYRLDTRFQIDTKHYRPAAFDIRHVKSEATQALRLKWLSCVGEHATVSIDFDERPAEEAA